MSVSNGVGRLEGSSLGESLVPEVETEVYYYDGL